MSYGRTHLIGGNKFKMTCLTGVYVLWEDMFSNRKCLMGGHVLQEDMSSGWHILQEDVSFWISYRRMCLTGSLTGEQVLLGGMSYRKACLTEGHILKEGMSYRRTYLKGGHILQEDMSYRKTCYGWTSLTQKHDLKERTLTRGHVREYRFNCEAYVTGGDVLLKVLFYWRTCFTGIHVL